MNVVEGITFKKPAYVVVFAPFVRKHRQNATWQKENKSLGERQVVSCLCLRYSSLNKGDIYV